MNDELKRFLDIQVDKYNQPSFIPDDPISIPHLFSKPQDIEIAGLFAATLAWGQRKTIINKCKELMTLMDHAPHDFIIHHEEKDLSKFLNFKHRTFNATDTLFFIAFLQEHYRQYDSLEDAFIPKDSEEKGVEFFLSHFHRTLFSMPYAPDRTRKHVATPERKSACKRLNMFLRWMVRKDTKGVDFGIWNRMNPGQLICPLDLHVKRVATQLGLLTRKQSDWKAAIELTENLRCIDHKDPVKYDFALFGLGVMEKH